MIRRYCDACGDELAAEDTPASLAFIVTPGPLDEHGNGWPKKPVTVKTIRSIDGVWNGGDICRNCLVRVITVAHAGHSGQVTSA